MSAAVPRKKPGEDIDHKLNKYERDAFYDHSSERAMAIVLSAIIEDHLTAILKFLMRRDATVAKELFRPSGPLGLFGTKIRMAYMLRVVDITSYKDLITISRIRNKFAHDLTITTFEDEQISAWIKNMHTYSVLLQMVAHLDKTENQQERIDRTAAYILPDEMSRRPRNSSTVTE